MKFSSSSNQSRLLINFGPLKAGGGQNVALNFLQELERTAMIGFQPYFIVSKNTMLHNRIKSSRWKDHVFVVSKNRYFRVFQEFFIAQLFIKKNNINYIYSYFGFGLFGFNIKQIIGSADSNLYFPEVDFWKNEKPHEKCIRWIVDKFRIFGLKKASGVIFENKAMYERATTLFDINTKALILPSIDTPDICKELNIKFKTNTPKVLLLCGWQRNKNILLIPEIAACLRELGFNAEFIITAEADQSSCSNEFLKLVEKWNVKDLINCIGTVEKSQLPELYKRIDLVLLLSLLESFSNNIIESWFYERPLVVSDELWSRSICADAAIYVQREKADKIAKAIIDILSTQSVNESLISNGKKELEKYPSINERLIQELNFIAEVIN
jgi:glycosyltransferase involved in cell wall biosynthesis